MRNLFAFAILILAFRGSFLIFKCVNNVIIFKSCVTRYLPKVTNFTFYILKFINFHQLNGRIKVKMKGNAKLITVLNSLLADELTAINQYMVHSSNIVKNYFKILEVISSLNIVLNTENRAGRRLKMSDLEVVALSLTSEYMSIDSENSLFNQLQNGQITNLIERSQYNKRRKKLFYFAEEIRRHLYSKFTEFEDYFVVDSMPLEICKMARHTRIKICKDDFQTSPDKGFCASQNTWFFGYKLHGVCTISGVFQSIDITKASVHDVHLLKDLKYQMSDCVLLGDRGYLSSTLQLDLFETANIKLETPMRTNQIGYKKQPYIFRKSRKRIETLFSQLCDQFMIRRNYAKSFQGFKTRILAKITALTLVQFINKFIFDRPINNIKTQII